MLSPILNDRRLRRVRKVAAILGLIVMLGFGGLIGWSRFQSRALLYGNLDLQNLQLITAELVRNKIEYTVDRSRSIRIQRDQVKRVRVTLALKGMPRRLEP